MPLRSRSLLLQVTSSPRTASPARRLLLFGSHRMHAAVAACATGTGSSDGERVPEIAPRVGRIALMFSRDNSGSALLARVAAEAAPDGNLNTYRGLIEELAARFALPVIAANRIFRDA